MVRASFAAFDVRAGHGIRIVIRAVAPEARYWPGGSAPNACSAPA
jgi:hypothetical protein